MKKFNFLKRLLFLPSVAIVALSSCDDKTPAETTSFALSSTDLTTIGTETTISRNSPATGEIIKINVAMEGSVTWKVQAKTGSTMFTITPSGEQSKAGEISIQVKPNTSFDVRTGKVVISDSYTKVDREISFSQAAAGTPVLSVTPGTTVSDIVAVGATCEFSITTNPATPLIFTVLGDAATWLTVATPTTEGATNAWQVGANPTLEARTGEIEISYDNGKKVLDTLYFNQVGATAIPTPDPVVASADVHAQNAVITWVNNPAVPTVEVVVNGKTITVPTADGKLHVNGLTAGTEYTVSMTGKTTGGTLDTKTAKFTTKVMTDVYKFKDFKLSENINKWLEYFANTSPASTAPATYENLAKIEDLILSFEFGESANGLVDLLQLPNIERIQIGRGHYDPKVNITEEKLNAVITQTNFPKLNALSIWHNTGTGDVNGSITEASVQVFTKFAERNQWITFDPDLEIGLSWPNKKNPSVCKANTTTSQKPGTVADLNLIDRSAWKVLSWTSQVLGDPVGKMLDSDFASIYHSIWTGGKPSHPLPHVFVFDMGQVTTVSELVLVFRQNGNKDSRPIVYTVSFSDDTPSGTPPTGEELKTLQVFPEPEGMTWTTPVQVINDVADFNKINTFTLPQPVSHRYMKLSITITETTDESTNISEFGVR